MTREALLSRLDDVRPRGSRYVARCPAHADRSPSLQVTDGDTGLLLKCWAGCTIVDICAALGLTQSDLFYDAGLPRSTRPILPRPPRINLRALAFQFTLAALDRRLRACRVLSVLTGCAIAAWPDATLDRLLTVVARAYADLDRAVLLEDVADRVNARSADRGAAA